MEWLVESLGLSDITSLAIVFLIIAAFCAGFIDAVAGGGGLLTVPALLSAGLPAHVTLGTNKLASTFGSLIASYTFYKKRLFSPLFWRKSLIATAIGAALGTLAVNYVTTDILEKLLPILIGFSALYALFNQVKEPKHFDLPTTSSKLAIKQVYQGLTLGFYDGFAGPGTGAFWTVSNLLLYKLNLLLASGVARTMNFVSNIVSLFTFIYLGHVNFAIGILMGIFLMAGAYVGAHTAIRYGQKFIRPVFTIVVSIMAIKLAIDAWS